MKLVDKWLADKHIYQVHSIIRVGSYDHPYNEVKAQVFRPVSDLIGTNVRLHIEHGVMNAITKT